MHDITPDAVVIGIDTHKDVHVAVAINGLGARLATASFPVTSKGYRQVATWATEHGTVHAFGIEGTGSYGAGLARALVAKGLRVIEVGRINRQLRRRHGKTDTVDAESAARAVLAGDADGEPKLGDGTVEMIRHLKIARDTALKARTQAMVTLKTMLVNAPQALRERFICITGKMTLIRAIAALRPGALVSTTASAKMALRALANRWLMLDAEIKEHEAVLEQLVRAHAPALMDAPGVSTGTIADMLIVLGDNPQRSDPRPRSPSYAACALCRHQVARPTVTGSTAVATDGRMRLCTASPWFACATIRRPANISSAEPPKASHLAKSGGASSATSLAKSTNTSALKSRSQQPRKALDQHRSINALAETINGLYKTEVIWRQRSWPSASAVEMATLRWVDWFNNQRLFGPIGYIPPAEAEANYYAARETLDMVA
jgi:transposase